MTTELNMTESKLVFCRGCRCLLKNWEPDNSYFCGAFEQCIPIYQVRVARKALEELASVSDIAIHALQKIDDPEHDEY
jgi:hypothetical protein